MNPIMGMNQVADRLQGDVDSPTPFRSIAVVAGRQLAMDQTQQDRVAWVVPLRDKPSTQAATRTKRLNSQEFEIVTAVQIYGDPSASKAEDAMTEQRRWLINRLHDWLPTSGDQQTIHPVKWSGGQRVAIDAATIWYADVFKAEVYY